MLQPKPITCYKISTLVKTCFSGIFDCSDLPMSMNGPNFDYGCPGAVFGDGRPNQKYCNGDGYNGISYPWWKQCCFWDGNKCQPKGN